MKLIIDIDEDIYKECQGSIYFPDTGGVLFNVVKNGTPLPDNATNGDMIKALFPNIEIFEPNKYEIAIKQNLGWIAFKKEWWNAPYKKGENND